MRPEDAPALRCLLYARESDEEVLAEIEKAIRGEREGKTLCLVADASGTPVATALLVCRSGKVGHVVNVVIDAPFRGTGLFGRLVAAFEAAGPRLGLKRLRLSAEHTNIAARKAYGKAGFHEIPSDDDLVRFEKRIGE